MNQAAIALIKKWHALPRSIMISASSGVREKSLASFISGHRLGGNEACGRHGEMRERAQMSCIYANVSKE